MKFAKKRQAIDFVIGPFKAKNGRDLDGIDLDVRLSRCAGNFVPRTDKTPAKHLGDGFFRICLSGHKDLMYTGNLLIVVSGKDVENMCQTEICVLSGNVYDSLFGDSGLLRVNVAALFGVKPNGS